MPTSYTYDDLFLALAREAYSGEEIVDLATTGSGVSGGTSAIFADLAYGSSGATTTAYHDTYLYLRRFSGLATAGGASTITLRTSMGTMAADVFKNFKIKITAGTSSGDERTISSNSNADPTQVTVDSAWTATPTTTSFYEIYPSGVDTDRITRTSKALHTASFTVASGTITVAPKFAGDAGASMLVGIGGDFLFCTEHPNILRTSLNRVIRNQRYPAYLPVSMLPDGDMENSDTLGTSESFTQWWGVDAPTTAAKSSTSYPFPFGRQYLNVVTAATDNEGVQSATVAVDPDEPIHVACMVQKTPAASETAAFDVVLYDVTNAADLRVVTVSGQQPVLVLFQQALESTTEEVAVRVLSNSAAATSFRVGPTLLWSGQRKRYAADTSSLERGRDIKRAYTLRPGQTIETDVYHIGLLEAEDFRVERDDRSNLINVVIPASSYPTFIQGDRRYPELTYDTDTTFAERDMTVQGAMYYVERARAARFMSSNPSLAGFHNSRAREYARTYSRMLEGTGISLVDIEDQSERQLVRFR